MGGRCCRGHCKFHKDYRGSRSNWRLSYDKGFSKCSICEVTFMTKLTHCPCCGNPLRTRPRGRVLKEKYLEAVIK